MLNVMVLKDAKLIEDVIINDEGKLIGLDPELVLFYENEIADVVCGNILFASHDEEGNTVGLSEEQKLHIMKNLYVGNWALNLMFGKEVAFINI